MSEIVLVVAIAQNGVIGNAGAIPWHISADMKRFKALTTGQTIVMGRKTWDSLPRKPLPNRTNVVLTRQKDWSAPGAIVLHSSESAHSAALLMSGLDIPDQYFVIGGADIYRAFLPLASRIELTEVHQDFDGDAKFEFDRTGWRESAREDHVTPEGLRYSYVTLVR